MNRLDPYSAIAPLYDLAVTPFLHRIRKTICTRLKTLQAEKVVDLGCGTGRQLRLLSRYGFHACGVDFSAAMLKKAAGFSPRTAVAQGDLTSTPFSSRSFDCALLCLALHENPWPVQKQIMAEALRITRPAGHVVILEHALPPGVCGRITSLPAHIPERLAGKKHYQYYQEFIKKGGLHGLLMSWPGLQTVGTEYFYLGNLVLLKVKKMQIQPAEKLAES